MADMSTEEIKKAIKGILKGADLDSLSAKKVRRQLESKFDADFSSRKKEIDDLVMKMITGDEDADEEEDEEETAEDDTKDTNGAGEDSDAEDEAPAKKAKKSSSSSSSSKEKPSKADKKRKSAGKADDSEDPVMSSIKNMDDEDLAKKLQEEESGLRRPRRAAAPKPRKERATDSEKKKKPSLYSRPCQLSEKLAAVVGTDEMPRSEVVTYLWSIAKERNLLDPDNRQFMICDEQMENLFGLKRVRLFGMLKYLKKHIKDKEKL